MFIKNHKIIGTSLIIISILVYFSSFSIEKNIGIKEKHEEDAILSEKIEQETEYFAILEIPKIELKRELFNTNDERNNVNKNIYVHQKSEFPKEVILAAHSGNGKNAYFKNLYKLSISDKIKIYYQNKIYEYDIEEIEYQNKTGKLYIKDSDLILITCTKNNKKTQTIYYAKLKKYSKLNNLS